MKVPDENFIVYVGPTPYQVTYDDGWAANSNNFGEHLGQTQEIILDPRIRTNEYRDVTFLHELLHAVFFQCGLNVMLQQDDKVSEEIIVEHLAPWLFMVLRDNQGIFG